MKQPFVSVMIPTWNPNPEYLKQAIDSVLIQDLGPDAMQIAVVDDCSTQIDVKELLASWGYLSRIAWFQNEHNLGIGGAWNSCIKHSRGEWVHILHQDDVLEIGYYKQFLQAKKNCVFQMFYNRVQFVDNDLQPRTFSKKELHAEGIIEHFEEKIFESDIQCPGVMVKRSVYEEIGLFDESLVYALDHEMWARIGANYTIYFHPIAKAKFRIHSDSQSSLVRKSFLYVEDLLKADEIMFSYIKDERKKKAIQMKRRKHLSACVLDNERSLSTLKLAYSISPTLFTIKKYLNL